MSDKNTESTKSEQTKTTDPNISQTKLSCMNATIIAALIAGICAVIGALISADWLTPVVQSGIEYIKNRDITPTPTWTPTLTPSPTPTMTPTPNILYFQDFESGSVDFDYIEGETEIASDPGGNHYFCLLPQGNDYPFVNIGVGKGWNNYVLEFETFFDKETLYGAAQVHVHYEDQAFIDAYEYNFHLGGAGLIKWVGDDSTWLQDHPITLLPETWSSIQIKVSQQNITVYQDGSKMIDYTDPEFIEGGFVRFSSSGKGRFCIDNIRVITANP